MNYKNIEAAQAIVRKMNNELGRLERTVAELNETHKTRVLTEVEKVTGYHTIAFMREARMHKEKAKAFIEKQLKGVTTNV